MLTGEFFIATIISIAAASLYVVRLFNKSNQRRYNERLDAFAKNLREL